MAMLQDRKCRALSHDSMFAVSFSPADGPASHTRKLAACLMCSYANDTRKDTSLVVVLALRCSHYSLPVSAELTWQH